MFKLDGHLADEPDTLRILGAYPAFFSDSGEAGSVQIVTSASGWATELAAEGQLGSGTRFIEVAKQDQKVW